MMGCFLFGATGKGVTAKGDALLGSVSDDPYDVRTFLKFVQKPHKMTHIGTELVSTTERSLVERGYFANPGETTRGINESGLAFTSAMILESELSQRSASPALFASLTTEMMDSCSTVEEAIALFSSPEAIAPAYSVLIADAEGGLVHLEVGAHRAEVYERFSPEAPGVVFAVNCYLSEKLESLNAPHTSFQNTKNNNQARRKRGQEIADAFQGSLTPGRLAEMLSDHQNRAQSPMDNPILEAWGYSICNHGTRQQESAPPEKFPWGTVSGEILEPLSRQFWYCYGWPCGEQPEYGDQLFQDRSWGEFIPFGFPQGASSDEIVELTTADGTILPEGRQLVATADLSPDWDARFS